MDGGRLLLILGGLSAAVEALARRAPLPVMVKSSVRDRLPDPVELAAYFVVCLAGLRDRLEALDAALSIDSEQGRGTRVCAFFSCAS